MKDKCFVVTNVVVSNQFTPHPLIGFYRGNPEESMRIAVRELRQLQYQKSEIRSVEAYVDANAFYLGQKPVAEFSGEGLAKIIEEDKTKELNLVP